jgi:hypothetical protein
MTRALRTSTGFDETISLDTGSQRSSTYAPTGDGTTGEGEARLSEDFLPPLLSSVEFKQSYLNNCLLLRKRPISPIISKRPNPHRPYLRLLHQRHASETAFAFVDHRPPNSFFPSEEVKQCLLASPDENYPAGNILLISGQFLGEEGDLVFKRTASVSSKTG